MASAKLFGTIFGMDYTTGLIIGAVVVVSYTFMGGFFAVCWTDFIQATMMLIAVIAIPSIIMAGSGGFAATMDAVNAQNPYLMSLFTNATTGKSIGLIALISSLAWGLGYFGMPHILVRFMSIKNAEDIKFSRRVAMTWVSICLGAAIMIAILGRYYVEANGITVADPERIFMILCQTLCHPAVAAILMAAILAAIMSTADSQLLVSASAFSNDLYKHLFRKNASNKEVMTGQELPRRGDESRELRLGRIRRLLRPDYAPCPVLEAYHASGRHRGHARGRYYRIRVEVLPLRILRRNLPDLRARARIRA